MLPNDIILVDEIISHFLITIHPIPHEIGADCQLVAMHKSWLVHGRFLRVSQGRHPYPEHFCGLGWAEAWG